MENLVKDLLIKEKSRLAGLLNDENEKIKKEVSSLFNFDFNYSIYNNSYDVLNMTFDILDESGKRLFGHSVDISQSRFSRKVQLNHGTMGSFNSDDTTRINLLLMTYVMASNLKNIEKIHKNHEEKLESILADIKIVEAALDRIKDEELAQKKAEMKTYVDNIILKHNNEINLSDTIETYEDEEPRVRKRNMKITDTRGKSHYSYGLKFTKKDSLGNWKVESYIVSYNNSYVEKFTCSYAELYDLFKENGQYFLLEMEGNNI